MKRKSSFERIFEMRPAFDRRHPDPDKNYGIHGCELIMILKGPKGAVQFVLYTSWHLPHVTKELLEKRPMDVTQIRCSFLPLPADLGYHSPTRMYDGQIKNENCQYLDGADCYYDGSGLNAERVYEILLKEGSEGVWRELENYYNDTFSAEV